MTDRPKTDGPKLIRMTQVAGRLMLDLPTTEEIGHVAEVLVDEAHHRVLGLASRSGLMGQRQRFGWQQVASVGKDGVVLKGAAQEDSALSQAISICGLEVWSEAGERVGQLADFEFNRQTGVIEHYLFTPEPATNLAPGLYGIAPEMVISAGRRRMMVRIEAVKSPERVEAGWSQPPSRSPLSEEPINPSSPAWRVPGLPEDLQSRSQQLAHQAQIRLREQFQERQLDPQALQDQWQEKSQQIADQAKDQFGQVMNRFRRGSKKLRHQLRETVTDWSDEFSDPQRLPRRQARRDPERRTIDVDPTEVWPEDDVSETSDQP